MYVLADNMKLCNALVKVVFAWMLLGTLFTCIHALTMGICKSIFAQLPSARAYAQVNKILKVTQADTNFVGVLAVFTSAWEYMLKLKNCCLYSSTTSSMHFSNAKSISRF